MTKRKVAIVSDSTSYIPENLVQKYGLVIVPQILNWESNSYLDGVEISNDVFYERLAASKTLPTTAQPSPGQFMEAFSQLKETAESVVCIVISDELSGTLDSARAAAGETPDLPIEVIDSRTTSMGLGLLVIKAARLAEEGYDHTHIAAAIRSIVPNVRLFFVVDTLDFLHKGGRIGGAQRLFGSVLSIKPILQILDGRIEPLESVRTKKKALSRLIEIIKEQTSISDHIHAAVVDATAPETANFILDQLEQAIEPVEIFRAGLSPVVGTHAGPGAIGVALLDTSSLRYQDH